MDGKFRKCMAGCKKVKCFHLQSYHQVFFADSSLQVWLQGKLDRRLNIREDYDWSAQKTSDIAERSQAFFRIISGFKASLIPRRYKRAEHQSQQRIKLDAKNSNARNSSSKLLSPSRHTQQQRTWVTCGRIAKFWLLTLSHPFLMQASLTCVCVAPVGISAPSRKLRGRAWIRMRALLI